MSSMNMTARITLTSRIAIGLATDLELDRGSTLIGTPWTRKELETYAQNSRHHVYCWTNDLADSIHGHAEDIKPHDPEYTGFEGEQWRNYRVCVGLRYGVETDSQNVVKYRSKVIDHMTVDTSMGEDAAYGFAYAAISDLASRWCRQDDLGKLICLVPTDSQKWILMLQMAGFQTKGIVSEGGDEFLHMEMEGVN